MQAMLICATMAIVGGIFARSMSNAGARFCTLGAFALLPILLAALVLFLEECDDPLPNGMCNGAGLTIMGVVAIMPFWLAGLAVGWWLKHRHRPI